LDTLSWPNNFWGMAFITKPSAGAYRYWSIMAAEGVTPADSSKWRIGHLRFLQKPDANYKAVNYVYPSATWTNDVFYTRQQRILFGKVGTNTDGDVDTHVFENLTGTIGLIKAVQIQVLACKKGASSVNHLKLISRPVSTDREGSEIDVLSIPMEYREILELNPETSQPWAESEVNASEFGYKSLT